MKKLLVFILILNIPLIWAQESLENPLTLKDAKKIFTEMLKNKDGNITPFIDSLDANVYKDLEPVILDSIENLIDSGELNYALILTEGILYLNIDNVMAQELYVIIINKTIEISERIVVEEEIIENKDKNLESVKSDIEGLYNAEMIASNIYGQVLEKKIVLNELVKERRFLKSISHNNFYPISLSLYTSEVMDSYLSRDKTWHDIGGVSGSLGNQKDFSFFIPRIDLSYYINIPEYSLNSPYNLGGDIFFSLGFKPVPVPIFISGGFYIHHFLFLPKNQAQMIVKTLPTPILGLSILDLKFLKILRFDQSIFYLIASAYTDLMDFGLFGKTALTIQLFNFGENSLELKMGIDYTFLSVKGFNESIIIPRVGIGISVYE
jgi:hypothetical protein